MAVSIRYRELIPLGWQQFAACREPGLAELFFGPSDDGDESIHTAAETQRIREALRICRACPVQSACLEHALRYPEPWGVWGGMTRHARSQLRTRLMQRRRRLANRREKGGR